jgi:hypothetical protein
MGKALELLTGFVTAPGTTLTALTMATGNSLTVRDAAADAEIRLLNTWVDAQAAGVWRVTSPRLHDTTQGIRFTIVASEPEPLFPKGVTQKLFKNDVLTAQLSGSATAGDIETACMLVYYSNMTGVDALFIGSDEIMRRGEHVFPVENTLSLGTAGGYSGEEAINAEFDLFKRDREYALLGYVCSAECAALRWRGSDTGNVGFGGPGHAERKELTGTWFKTLTEVHGMPLIPVFHSNNVGNILIDGAQDENGTDVTVNSIFVLLAPR